MEKVLKSMTGILSIIWKVMKCNWSCYRQTLTDPITSFCAHPASLNYGEADDTPFLCLHHTVQR